MMKRKLDPVEEERLESLPATDPAALSDAPIGFRYGPSLQRQSSTRVLLNGVISAIIGYAMVSAFFGVASVLSGHSPFHVPALLGGALFFGRGADAVVEPGAVIAFNGVHLLVFLIAGVFMAWIASISERVVEGWYLALSLVMYIGAHVVVVPLLFDEPVRAQLSLWLVTGATTAAATAMGAYLWKAYPGMRMGMHQRDDNE